MKEELTREVVEALANCNGVNCPDCKTCQAIKICDNTSEAVCKWLAEQLLEEMDNPKVWDGAPEDALQAQITWFTKNGGYIGMKTYTRELPKTRARIMAEEIAAAQISNKSDLIDIIEQTIKTHMKELKGEE